MSILFRAALSALLTTAPFLTACIGDDGGSRPAVGTPSGAGGNGSASSSTAGGNGIGGDLITTGTAGAPACDPTLTVQSSGPALVVTDPAILAAFPLERVLQQLLDRSAPSTLTPLTLLQRLFDTENAMAGGVFPDVVHCDSPGNIAFKNAAPLGCPRAEGALATRPGLLTPGDEDFFAPIALVNRFDLTPVNALTCGEYRLVYAKWSGRTNPKDRVFIIFEGSLPNPQPDNLFGCHPVAEAWASLEKIADPAGRAKVLEGIYFEGSKDRKPVVDPGNFGLLAEDDSSYQISHGQVRLSQRMEDPWELREYHFLVGKGSTLAPHFEPVTVKNSPSVSLFAPAGGNGVESFQLGFVNNDVPSLAATSISSIRMSTINQFNEGESVIDAETGPSYLAAAESGDAFLGEIDSVLGHLKDLSCDPGDPLTAEGILARATTQTCAGCHAPRTFLGEGRKLGCGLVWPDSLGGPHIDEAGKLSPALTEVFLPRRAEVMSTYLKACDKDEIMKNLQPLPPGSGIPN